VKVSRYRDREQDPDDEQDNQQLHECEPVIWPIVATSPPATCVSAVAIGEERSQRRVLSFWDWRVQLPNDQWGLELSDPCEASEAGRGVMGTGRTACDEGRDQSYG
jgi:hypothetical protein